jgi:hypothetical protein
LCSKIVTLLGRLFFSTGRSIIISGQNGNIGHHLYPLAISPSVIWNSFLGTSGTDYGKAIALDASGGQCVS